MTNLIILGATARAAAFSAQRAGMRPWCVDLFADADLARACPARRVALDAFPAGLIDALAGAPDGPVIYTGGLENRPDGMIRCRCKCAAKAASTRSGFPRASTAVLRL